MGHTWYKVSPASLWRVLNALLFLTATYATYVTFSLRVLVGIPYYLLYVLAFAYAVIMPSEISRVEEVKPKMQINVFDKGSGKLVRLEVEPHHTIGSLIETLVSGLKLQKGEYALVLSGREFGADECSKTLKSVGIRDGAELELVKRQ